MDHKDWARLGTLRFKQEDSREYFWYQHEAERLIQLIMLENIVVDMSNKSYSI